MDENPTPKDEVPFGELAAQLIEQAAALAGERAAAPIRRAGAVAARALALAALAGGAFLVGLVFLAVAIGYGIRMAADSDRWWICLAVAVGFLAIGGLLAMLALRRRAPETNARGNEDAQ